MASQLPLNQIHLMWYQREKHLQTLNLGIEMWTGSVTRNYLRTVYVPLRCAWLSITFKCRRHCRSESVLMDHHYTMPAKVSFPFIPLKSESGLQCAVCLGRSDIHPKVKTYTYARKDTVQKHFRTHQLQREFPKGRICDYPKCEKILYSLPQYEFH